MKYIKTYESVITLDLDDDAKFALLAHALDYGNVQIVKDLFKNGVNPNTTREGLPILAIECEKNKPNLELVQAIIDAGANVNIEVYASMSLICYLIKYLKSGANKTLLMETLKRLIRAGADLNKRNNNWNKSNFFDDVDEKLKNQYLTKGFVQKLMKMIQTEAPEQYERHILEKDVEKYNL